MKLLVPAMVVTVVTLLGANVSQAQTTGTPVFTNLPAPTPPNVPSQGFQCCQGAEIGDEIRLEADTPRRAGYATVLMSSWSLNSDYSTLPSSGYVHPITLNIYSDAANAAAHTPAKTVTQSFTIPWRPAADSTCPGGTAWRATDGKCYNGFAFTIVFDLRALTFRLPSQFIYGVAYNTDSWGYQPIGIPGPYDSLNVGTANVNGVAAPPSVGTDVNPDVVYWNSSFGGQYADGGAGGLGIFRPDTGWTDFPIAAKFTTFAVANDPSDCRNGGWQNVIRRDFTTFKSQAACINYAERRDDRDDRDDGR